MSKKSIYFYKVEIKNAQTNTTVQTDNYRQILTDIFNRECINGSLKLTLDQYDPIVMDVLENTDEYLFARLSRKRPNNSMQKRNYKTFETTEVLTPDEIESNGIECFTYCILGYSHGVLSISNSKGAPGAEAFSFLLATYNRSYYAECIGIPNNDLIKELLDGKAPKVTRISIDMARPSAQMLQQLFGFNDAEVITAVNRKTASLVVDVKPDFRDHLIDDRSIISRLIRSLRNNQARYNTIKISGKKDNNSPQREYDLYEEYFKYPIEIKEYRQEGGKKIEISKAEILRDYKLKMANIYDQYKEVLLLFAEPEHV